MSTVTEIQTKTPMKTIIDEPKCSLIWKGRELEQINPQPKPSSSTSLFQLFPTSSDGEDYEISRIKKLPTTVQLIVEDYLIDKTKILLETIQKDRTPSDFLNTYSRTITCLDLSDIKISNKQIACLLKIAVNLKSLIMPDNADHEGGQISDKLLSSKHQVNTLRHLYNQVFQKIEALKHITHLDVSRWVIKIANGSLPISHTNQLLNGKNLEYLNLSGCDIGDKQISCIIESENITHLILGQCTNMTNIGLLEIAKLYQLKHLELSDNKWITDEGFKDFKGHEKLEHLTITILTGITDKTAEIISTCRKLRHIDFSYCPKLTNATLKSIANLENVEHIIMKGCRHVQQEQSCSDSQSTVVAQTE